MKINNKILYIKKYFLAIILFFGLQLLSAQIKIGDNPNVIDTNSVLELESTSRAFVITRVTTAQMLAITPLQGGLVYNTDEQCVFYFNGAQWSNLCQNTSGNSLSITDNSDGTYSVDDGINPPFTFNGADETTSTLENDGNDNFTYTDETGQQTTFSTSGGSSNLTITDNLDGTYTVDDGTNPPFTFNGSDETTSTLENDGNDNFTYTDETGQTTTFSTTGGSSNIPGTAGSVFFSDGTTASENNTELFWDNTNNKLNIGSNTPNLNHKVNITGDIGTTDGSAATPSYSFSNDTDTGIYRVTDDELGFSANGAETMKIDETALLINNAIPFHDSPFIIRGKGEHNRFMAFQSNGNTNTTELHINMVGYGFNMTDQQFSRLFIQFGNNKFIGIKTGSPTAELDVNGKLRVRDLPNSPGNLPAVVVDANGNFYKTTSTTLTGKTSISSTTNNGGRWTNSNTTITNLDKDFIVPIFDLEDYKDGGSSTYNVIKKSLQIVETGRYTITTNVSLVLKNTSFITQNVNVRLLVNGTPKGSLNSITNDNNTEITQSIAINDVLQLNTNDILSIQITTNGKTEDILVNTQGTSSFTITRIK
ncbi:hypothetical protein [uncultured Maribacter sp.]|uniref:hypothetical protein n=1 Tax=uncultured Maribacter sp. TaxID=431308 RepID=UPI0026351655|nr:hypothetical protein [uncultured Maribacter sp.]